MFVGTRYMTIINCRFVGHAKDVIIVKLLVVEGEKCRALPNFVATPTWGAEYPSLVNTIVSLVVVVSVDIFFYYFTVACSHANLRT